jgi:hypothetical protein
LSALAYLLLIFWVTAKILYQGYERARRTLERALLRRLLRLR